VEQPQRAVYRYSVRLQCPTNPLVLLCRDVICITAIFLQDITSLARLVVASDRSPSRQGDDHGPTPQIRDRARQTRERHAGLPPSPLRGEAPPAQRRQTALTELGLEGVRLRLETPPDPRDILVLQDNTVMQELELMIDARI